MLGFANDASVFRGPFRETCMRPLGRKQRWRCYSAQPALPPNAEIALNALKWAIGGYGKSECSNVNNAAHSLSQEWG